MAVVVTLVAELGRETHHAAFDFFNFSAISAADMFDQEPMHAYFSQFAS